MIAHEIEVVKDSTPSYNYQGWVQPSKKAVPDIKSQADLDKWLEETAFSVGDFITYQTYPITSGSLPHSVKVIAGFVTDYETMTLKRYAPWHPEIVKLKTLPNLFGDQTDLLDDVNNMRRLTENEYQTLVRPYLDRVRDRSQPQT